MTLDEAIIYEDEILKGFEKAEKVVAVTQGEYEFIACHRQLAEWLRELKQYKEQDQGEWIKIQSGDEKFPESIVCSRCNGENSYFNEWDEHSNPISKTFITSKYCPNCGARMGKEQK